MGEVIGLRGIGKSFAGKPVFPDLTLTLGEGHLLALIGANGGGKTTLLRMLAGVLPPDRGAGHVLGREIRDGRAIDRAAIGYMAQRGGLYHELTVQENLGFRADVHGLASGAVDAALAEFGLADVADRRVGRLSGGWERRVHLAATMMHRPRLLLLDEPTAGLDLASCEHIWVQLRAAAASGTAIVVSTHELAQAGRCPTILYFQDGQVTGPIAPRDLARDAGAESLEDAVRALAEARG